MDLKSLIHLISLILSTYRLTKLVNEDYLLKDFRQKVWTRYPKNTKIGYLFTCPWCMSIWMAAGLLLIKQASPKFYDELCLLLTASAVTGILNERL